MSTLPSTIKAIGFRKNGDLDVIEEFKELPFPEQKEDEVLIKVEHAGVNYIDTYERAGLVCLFIFCLHFGLIWPYHKYPTKSFPKILGHEAGGIIVGLPTSGKVLEDGEYKRRGFKEGTRVGAVSLPTSH